MHGYFIPKGTLVEICDCGVAVYRVGTGENEIIADCEKAGSIRPRAKLGGAGFQHKCQEAKLA